MFVCRKFPNFTSSSLNSYIILIFFQIAYIMIPVMAFAEAPPYDAFTLYESIRPNVAFWKKVYGEYTTSQAIIHDRRNPLIIYEVISLKDVNGYSVSGSDQRMVERRKKRCAQVLRSLASGHGASSSEEKRICALFKSNNALKLLRNAHLNIRVQLGQKDRFRSGLIRSGAYFDEIRKILKSYNIPEDLAYLPHVESSFDYQAYSRLGAAGIWQFTHDTGTRYMKIDYTLDERRDPILATHAAARFLKDNYAALGCWPTALTAYNHGAQGMKKAQKSKGDYESIFKTYNGPSFGFASRNFYSEFLAARDVARNYRKYFGELIFDPPIKRRRVELPDYMAIDDLSRHFDVSLKTLKELNPALREPVFSGQKYAPKGCRIYLPMKSDSGIEIALKEIPARLLKTQQKPSLFYRVKKGDTAIKIAKQHNVKLKNLILANNLNAKAIIYPGQNLRIPGADEKIVLASLPSVSEAKDNSITSNRSRERAQDFVSTKEAAKKAETPESKTVPVVSLQQEKAQPLLAGRPSIPYSEEESVNPDLVTGNLSIEKITTAKGRTIGTILVEPNETLGHYADWLEVATKEIRKLNRFPFARQIHVGQKIKVPLGKVSKEQFEEKRYEYHKEIEEDFFSVYKVAEIQEYIIEKSDNIWSLCQEKFELPFWILKKYNPETDFSNLTPSKSLKIPVVVKIVG